MKRTQWEWFLTLLFATGIVLGCKSSRSELESDHHGFKSSVSVDAKSFVIDGQPKLLRGGSLQWFRIPPEEWEDRVKSFKAAGYNTIDMYAAWRNHEPKEGVFDFKTFDIKRFLDLAKKYDLYVYFRPGPYITNEMDGGGIPAWVIAKSGKRSLSATERDGVLNLRTQDADYLDAVDRYWKALITEIKPYFHSHGGPIILFGVENEYNWFATFFNADKLSTYLGQPERSEDQKVDISAYLGGLRDIAIKYGVDVPITTCPGEAGTEGMGSIEGILPMPNFYGNDVKFSEYYAYSQLRDMHDPSKDLGHYNGFPSGTTETERSISTLRRQIMGGLDAVMQFNIFGYHQEGRQNSVTLASGSPQLNLSFIKSITNFDVTNAANAFLEPPFGYFHNVIDFYGAVSPGGVIREKFYGLRRTNLFLTSFESLISRAGVGKRSSSQKIEGQDNAIEVKVPGLGSLDPDAKKARVNYWLSLANGGALLGLLNEGKETIRVPRGGIRAFGESIPVYSEIVIAPEIAPGTEPRTEGSEQAYDALIPIKFPLGKGQTLAYSTSEILTLRDYGSSRLLIVYGVEGSDGEMRIAGPRLKPLSGQPIFKNFIPSPDGATLVFEHKAFPQKASFSDDSGQRLDLLVLNRDAAGRTWFVPRKDGGESLFIGPAMLDVQDTAVSLQMDKAHAELYVSDDVVSTFADFRDLKAVPGFRRLALKGEKDFSFRYALKDGVTIEDVAESLADFDDGSFARLGDSPSALERNGIFEGHAWYRAHVNLTEAEAASPSIFLESVSDFAGLYVNGRYLLTLAPLGTEVNNQGKTNDYRFNIPSGVFKKGDNTLAIRTEIWGHGSFMFPRGELNRLQIAGRIVKIPWARGRLPALGYDGLKGLEGKASVSGKPLDNWTLRAGLGGNQKNYSKNGADRVGWQPSALPLQLEAGAIRWYEFNFEKSDLPDAAVWDAPLAMTLKGTSTKATIYLNGRLIGRWLSDVNWLHRGNWARPLRDMWMNTDPDSFPFSEGMIQNGSNKVLLLVEDASDQTAGQKPGRIDSVIFEIAREEKALVEGRSVYVPKVLRKVKLDLAGGL